MGTLGTFAQRFNREGRSLEWESRRDRNMPNHCQFSRTPISLSEMGKLLIQPIAMHYQTGVLSSELQNEKVNVIFSCTRMYNINSI